ncbi:MAG: hypothetical protein KDI50_07370 [Candidatus Competibacteraceae bacterium]|nr:hypothetical protein [Candidatus Competibacteraceae bacterium]
MKPKTNIVMVNIIQQIKETFPFSMSEDELCVECVHGCPKKLLEYLHMQITEWEERLENGEIPSFQDIKNLSNSSKKIYKALEKNNLVSSHSSL